MTKQLKRVKTLPKVENVVEFCYCRKCTKTKSAKENFYLATDKFLDTNGYMSICKECVSDIYIGFYNSEHNVDRAIYKTCKAINVRYEQSAVDATKTQIANKEKLDDDPKIFGIYKTKIISSTKGVGKMGDIEFTDLTFQIESSSIPSYSEDEKDFEGSEGVVEFWGDGFDASDYRFLEKEFADWKRSYSCQNKAEEFFLKQVCLKSLALEKARVEGGSGDNILKSLQELLKNAALTPAQQTAASSGKGTETWGVFIKNIEETTPAEFYKDKELFKDFDDIGSYIKKYITRPLKNFVTGARDFNITEDDNTEYDDGVELEGENVEETGKTE